MSDWHPLKNQGDLDKLLDLCGGFHDGCIREAYVWTESYVLPNLHMSCPGNLDAQARILLQRQFKDPSAVELLFRQVLTVHFQSTGENYDSIIYSSTLLQEDDVFYWANWGEWTPTMDKRDGATWIASKELFWRDVSDWMGDELRYGRLDGLPS